MKWIKINGEGIQCAFNYYMKTVLIFQIGLKQTLSIFLLLVLSVVKPFYAVAFEKQASNLCKEKSSFLKNSLDNNISVEQLLLVGDIGKSDIVFFGVEHYNFESDLYPLLAEKLKKINPGLDCFFVEETLLEFEQKILNSLNNGEALDQQTLNDTFGRDRAVLFQKIHSMGLKIYYVDPPWTNKFQIKTEEDELSWLNKRDLYMANLIYELKNSNKCKKSFYPVGFSHLVKISKRLNLKTLLNDKYKIKTAEFLLLIAGRNSNAMTNNLVVNPSWIWQKNFNQSNSFKKSDLICEDNFIPDKSMTAFMNEQSKVPIGYLPDSNSLVGTYGEFLGTVVFTCKTSSCNQINSIFGSTKVKLNETP
ncbi:MAG: hypothetical protein L6Q37_07710 [Bdellovibrionaceae bacterium]|nr:hypothetical protein [Pseudobdellovibrionaceae bacterium]NUM57387.1 hypothetical protein [Pseudobdellovibrionaceae bacterium]